MSTPFILIGDLGNDWEYFECIFEKIVWVFIWKWIFGPAFVKILEIPSCLKKWWMVIARVKQRWGKRYNKIEHLSFPSPSFQSASFSLALPMIRLFLNPGFKLLLYFIVEISTNFIIERGRLPPQYVIPDLFSNVYVCSCVFISIIVT